MIPPVATLVRADNPGPMTLSGTNTWVLAGPDGRMVVDPGPLDEAHLRRVSDHGPVTCVLLTHRHPDHAEGAQRFAEMTGAAVLDRADLADGVVVGPVRVMHTPGHTGDSVCFVIEGATPAVLTGDTILGRGTSVVAHPDGDLGAYLSSLRRLADLGDLTVLPGHGPVLASVRAAATGYLAHRADRLEQVREALAVGDRTAGDVVRRVYAAVDRALWPAAEMSVRAQLAYLEATPG